MIRYVLIYLLGSTVAAKVARADCEPHVCTADQFCGMVTERERCRSDTLVWGQVCIDRKYRDRYAEIGKTSSPRYPILLSTEDIGISGHSTDGMRCVFDEECGARGYCDCSIGGYCKYDPVVYEKRLNEMRERAKTSSTEVIRIRLRFLLGLLEKRDAKSAPRK